MATVCESFTVVAKRIFVFAVIVTFLHTTSSNLFTWVLCISARIVRMIVAFACATTVLISKIIIEFMETTVHRKETFPSKESDTKILQNIFFAYEVGIISSYSNWIIGNHSVFTGFAKSCNRFVSSMYFPRWV